MIVSIETIPREAFKLMRQHTPGGIFEYMCKNAGLTLLEALTFPVCNTPITYNKTGDTVGCVLYWHNNFCSVHTVMPGDWLKLIGQEVHDWPTLDEAVNLFEKYLNGGK